MNEEDRLVLHEILGRGEGFGHRQHVELAWRLLTLRSDILREDTVREDTVREDTARGDTGHVNTGDAAGDVADAVADAVRMVAAAHGRPGRFHETITRSWVRCVAVHQERWPAATFGEFLDRNPRLLDPGLLGHFYSPGLLASAAARDQWVAPDRHALPALAA
jgi:hypothetical protein